MSKNVKIFLDNFSFIFIIELMGFSALMTIEDLADYLKVSRRTIYEWLKAHKIPAVKLVGQWRFQKEKIDAWMERQAQA